MVNPSTKGSNGRDEHGRFMPGHPGGPGNPHAKQTGKLRSAMLKAVTEKDMRDLGSSSRRPCGARSNRSGVNSVLWAIAAVTEKDMCDVVLKLVELAKSGNVPAAKEVLDRCLGRPVEADLIERLDQVEELLKETPYL